MAELTLPLRGAGGEPVDFRRTVLSHGCVQLPPMAVEGEGDALEATVRLRGGPRTLRLEPHDGDVRVAVRGRARADEVTQVARHLLRLDDDLSGFYALAAGDPELAWAVTGAGRMVRSTTVFEDVVKTICTTNCAWSATERMVGAIVGELGEPAPGGGRAFPTPEAMAEAPESFYTDVVRAGYRGRYLRDLAARVAGEELDLEALGAVPPEELPDDELEVRLLALPGVGPYAAAHVMMMLGRSSRLILDSWTRPKYARLAGRRTVADRTIIRRFRRYGRWAGLAFWLYLTRDWVPESQPARSAT